MLQTVNRIKALERMVWLEQSIHISGVLTTCERIEEQGLTGLLSVLPERIQQN